MSLSLRIARPSDVGEILAVQRGGDGATTERFRAWLVQAMDAENERVCVAQLDERIVGWAATRRFDEAAEGAPAGHYLMGVRIMTAHRGKSVGSMLVAARLELIRRAGGDQAYYFTNARNTASIATHRRWGFEEQARAPRFRGVPFGGGEGILFAARLG